MGHRLTGHETECKHPGRIDNIYGDRNLVCSCVGVEAYATPGAAS